MQKHTNPQKIRRIYFRGLGFFVLISLWGLAIAFKAQMSGFLKVLVFVFLVLLSFAGIYWLNRSIFRGGSHEDH